MADKYDKAAQAEKASLIGKHLNTFTHTLGTVLDVMMGSRRQPARKQTYIQFR